MADEMSKVWIDGEECIACAACEGVCPDVFLMEDDTCVVKPEAQQASFLQEKNDEILEAIESCPVDAIKHE